eukprot:6989186-Prymnesium_polylepis.1
MDRFVCPKSGPRQSDDPGRAIGPTQGTRQHSVMACTSVWRGPDGGGESRTGYGHGGVSDSRVAWGRVHVCPTT